MKNKFLQTFIIMSIILCTYLSFTNDVEASYTCMFQAGDICAKKTYKYKKDGAISPIEITIGIDYDSASKREYIYVTNSCLTTNESCHNYLATGNSDSPTTIIRNTSLNQAEFPKAVCSTVSEGLTVEDIASNYTKYLYFTDDEISNAECNENDILYYESTSKVCTNMLSGSMFKTNVDSSNRKVSVTTIPGNVCQISVMDTVTNKNIITKSTNANPGDCMASNYSVKCSEIGDPTSQDKYQCNIYQCGSISTTCSKIVGTKCTLYNMENSSDSIEVWMVDNQYVKDVEDSEHPNKDPNSSYSFSILHDGYFGKKLQNNLDISRGMQCPNYVYFNKSEKTYVMLDEDSKTVYEENYTNNDITKYQLKNANDTSDICSNEITEYGLPTSGKADYSYDGEVYCGIFGEKTWGYVKNIYTIIKILIPALIIVLGMVDFMKVLFSGEEKDMKIAGQRFLKRIIAGVIFILLPILLEFAMGLFGFSENCLGALRR